MAKEIMNGTGHNCVLPAASACRMKDKPNRRAKKYKANQQDTKRNQKNA
jgi:hypothetical protein